MKSKKAKQPKRISNKGRITRFDQARVAADRENIERGRIVDIDQAYAEAWIEHCTRGRVMNVTLAWHAAHAEENQRKAGSALVTISTPVAATPATTAKPTKAEPLGNLEFIEVPVSKLRAALIVASSGDIRYYLNAVHIVSRDGQAEIVTTNGHMMLLQSLGKITNAPDWLKVGVTIKRTVFEQIFKLERNGLVRIGFGKNHTQAVVKTMPDWATLRGDVIDAKFPDYTQIMRNTDALDCREGVPLFASGFNPKYIKAGTSVAQELGAQSLHLFQSPEGGGASVVTFGEKASAALYIMPTRADAMTPETVKLLAPAMARTAAALKAHITRNQTAFKTLTGPDAERVKQKLEGLESRLSMVLKATGTKQIENRTSVH
jgi:hypothetical protein